MTGTLFQSDPFSTPHPPSLCLPGLDLIEKCRLNQILGDETIKAFLSLFFWEARKDNDSCTPDPSEENTGDKNAAAISVTF